MSLKKVFYKSERTKRKEKKEERWWVMVGIFIVATAG